MPMPDAPFSVRFEAGVTPGKWERVWHERMRRAPLALELAYRDEAFAALRSGDAHMAFLRDVDRDDEFHAIPLYRELPVVVAPKGSVLEAADEVSLADIAAADLPILDGSDAATVELVAANVGVAVMPRSVARLHARKDVVARPVSDAPDTGISLVWSADAQDERIDVFIGIVRGRTANSSR